MSLALAVLLAVDVAEMVCVPLCEAVPLCETELLCVFVLLREDDSVIDSLREGVVEAVTVAVPEIVLDDVCVLLLVIVIDAEAVGVREADGGEEPLTVAVKLPD